MLVSTLPAKSFLIKASLIQLFLFEVIGMIIFSYGITCTTTDGIDFQVMISILLGVIISGYLCGANFNPCVTLMNLIRK
jgi:glycerol uptake facilitator-like aquaporin